MSTSEQSEYFPIQPTAIPSSESMNADFHKNEASHQQATIEASCPQAKTN